MADTPLQIWWNNFTGWINDQKYQWQAWRYLEWFWVDTQRFDVKPTTVPKLKYTAPATINAIFNLGKITSNPNSNILWTDAGKIIYSTLSWETEIYSITWDAKQWYNIWFLKPNWSTEYKLYYFHNTITTVNPKQIHRSSINWGSFEEDYRNYTSTSWNSLLTPPVQPNWVILRNEWDRILFSYYNEIWKIDRNELVTKVVEFPSEQNIVWITEFWWEYKVYVTSWFATSKIYRWDWDSAEYDVSIDLQWLAIIWWVCNNWAYDYFIWDNSLYLVAWVQYQKLYDSIQWEIMTAFDDKVIIQRKINWKYCLFEYSEKPWYKKWLHPKLLIDNANQEDWEIWAVDYSSRWLIFSSDSKFFTQTLWTTQAWDVLSYIESLVFVWDNIQYDKIINSIILKFSWFTTNLVKFYVQLNENWTWIKLFEWNNNTVNSTNHWYKISSNTFLNPVWTFNTIRFRVEFPHNWNNPQWKFYWVDLFGKQNIWQ